MALVNQSLFLGYCQNFFGVNFGTSRILGAPAAEFSPFADDTLLTQETGGTSGLFRLFWDGLALQTVEVPLSVGSEIPGQWEHVTFARAGIVEVPPIPEPSTLALAALALLSLLACHRRRRA